MSSYETETLSSGAQVHTRVSGDVTFHSYVAPEEGALVCTHVVETPSCVVVVDAQLMMPYAREVRAYVDALGKPVERLILTHGHPDHYAGLEAFEDLPIYATPMTRGAVEMFGEAVLGFKRQMLGERAVEFATKTVVPTHELREGPFTVDGVTFVAHVVPNTEQAEITMLELPDHDTLIAMDVVYNGVHLAVGDMNMQRERMWDGWIEGLQRVASMEPGTILPGHGAPCDASVIPGMIAYIEAAREIFEGGADEAQYRSMIRERFPELAGRELIDDAVIFLYHSNW